MPSLRWPGLNFSRQPTSSLHHPAVARRTQSSVSNGEQLAGRSSTQPRSPGTRSCHTIRTSVGRRTGSDRVPTGTAVPAAETFAAPESRRLPHPRRAVVVGPHAASQPQPLTDGRGHIGRVEENEIVSTTSRYPAEQVAHKKRGREPIVVCCHLRTGHPLRRTVHAVHLHGPGSQQRQRQQPSLADSHLQGRAILWLQSAPQCVVQQQCRRVEMDNRPAGQSHTEQPANQQLAARGY